jgi:tRNA G18 (ribose-2'-O)-methylase SpoU
MASDAIRIPMRGEVESLNVAAAATIVLYEAARQRGLSRVSG